MRHNAHPSQKDRRQATPEEEALHDVTPKHVGTGIILQPGNAPDKKRRPNKSQRGDV